MENSFQKYIASFNELSSIEKKDEIIKHLKELFEYLKEINNDLSYPVYDDYESDDEFLSVAFNYIIAIKELTAISVNGNNN